MIVEKSHVSQSGPVFCLQFVRLLEKMAGAAGAHLGHHSTAKACLRGKLVGRKAERRILAITLSTYIQLCLKMYPLDLSVMGTNAWFEFGF